MKKLKKAIRLLEVLKAGVGRDEWGWALNYALNNLRLKEKIGSTEQDVVVDKIQSQFNNFAKEQNIIPQEYIEIINENFWDLI